MKRIISLILALLTLFALTSCDSLLGAIKNASMTTDEQETAAPDDTTASDDTTEPEDTGTDPQNDPQPEDTTASPETTAEPETTEEPETTAAPEPGPVDFEKEFDGTWTADDGRFIDFSIENGKTYMFFAIWNAGGFMPAGEVTKVHQTEPLSWDVTVHHDRVEFHEDYDNPDTITGVSEAYDEEFIVTFATSDSFVITLKNGDAHYWYGTYKYYPDYQFPDNEEPYWGF